MDRSTPPQKVAVTLLGVLGGLALLLVGVLFAGVARASRGPDPGVARRKE